MESLSDKIREWIETKFSENFDFSNQDLRAKEFESFCNQNPKELQYSKHRTLFLKILKETCERKGIDSMTYGLTRPVKSFQVKKNSKIEAHITPKPKGGARGENLAPKDETQITDELADTGSKMEEYEITPEMVGEVFNGMSNIVAIRFKEWDPLTPEEKMALGTAWLPIFKIYKGKILIWLSAGLATASIFGGRAVKVARARNKDEKKEIPKDKADKQTTPKETTKLDEHTVREKEIEKPEGDAFWLGKIGAKNDGQ